jgi:hypothetical protein
VSEGDTRVEHERRVVVVGGCVQECAAVGHYSRLRGTATSCHELQEVAIRVLIMMVVFAIMSDVEALITVHCQLLILTTLEEAVLLSDALCSALVVL